MSEPKISDISNEDKLDIITRWCSIFHISQSGQDVVTIMNVRGFSYPVETYITWGAALNESYIRAHAHTWSVCRYIEEQREQFGDKR
jgi:hypothetical protein